jgi:hypothetical protein
MSNLTPTELRNNIYNVLDEVLVTGIPVEIIRKGKILKIIAADTVDKLQNFSARPEFITGDSEDLPEIHWDEAVKLDNIKLNTDL